MSSAQTTPAEHKLKKKDFDAGIDVRWCPGCGDYSILANIQRGLAAFGARPENTVFISGIGCSSRFPYYMNTFGFHGIHGRAPAIATGLKVARPDLDVWVITGDGDGLSIGGNHFIHAIRRNIDLKIILFNNRIYGLTKGQYSPTSPLGMISKSSPMGSLDNPFNPLSVALGSEATFVARSVDTDAKVLQEVITAAYKHKGTALIEVYQNCTVFNDGTFDEITDRKVKDDRQLHLQAGQKMIFGKEHNKGIIMRNNHLVVATIGEDGVTEDDVLVHDPAKDDPSMAFWLSRFELPDYPIPFGVFRDVERPTYEEGVTAQIAVAREKKGRGDMHDLLFAGDTWTVK